MDARRERRLINLFKKNLTKQEKERKKEDTVVRPPTFCMFNHRLICHHALSSCPLLDPYFTGVLELFLYCNRTPKSPSLGAGSVNSGSKLRTLNDFIGTVASCFKATDNRHIDIAETWEELIDCYLISGKMQVSRDICRFFQGAYNKAQAKNLIPQNHGRK